jgi:DNA-binding transcriptional ArsR family regulator
MPNPYGDIELDAQGIRALAHPVRLAILERLQRHGPSTATALAPEVGASPSVTSWHLRHLAGHALVRDSDHPGTGRERWWEASARGFRFTPTDPAGREAQRMLVDAIEQVEGDVPGAWRRDVEPHLEDEWRDLSGRASTRILVTPAELVEFEAKIEQLLAPYVLRKDQDPATIPGDARSVRLLRYTLPEAAEKTDG